MKRININKLVVPLRFKCTPPNKVKVTLKKQQIKQGVDLIVTLNRDLNVVDGYASLIAYQQLGYKSVPFIIVDSDYVPRPNQSLDSLVHRHKIYERDGKKCYICNRDISIHDMTLDHVIPKSKGGKDSLSNLKCCCELCNGLKGNFTYSKELVAVIKNELKERNIL